ncbi:serine-type carboxypeptidase [Aureococcus anophagefferens]|uniref:Serine-type carboxypeptidase n=1 Tax=Aureococcus anophagefferens TaxID=44056 RepID=A0ABR1FXX1_AURAN
MRSTVLLGIVATAQASNSDVVEALPGLDIPVSQCWKSYTGYLDVEAGTKALFHWYHEAVDDAASKPLPAGVGFSYPNATIDDATTASDTYEALVAFFAAHPELEGRDFYVAGGRERAAITCRTRPAVEAGNAALPENGAARINLKGFMVGNGYCDWQLDFNANVENGRYHALTSQADFEAAQIACGGDFARCFWPRDDVHCPAACGDAVEATTKWAMDGSIDIYDIYEDVCLDADQERLKTQAFVLEAERRSRRADGFLGATTISPVFPTCADTYVKKYLNTPAVQAAIGVRAGTIPGGAWADCGVMTSQYEFNYASELPNYERWTKDGDLEILIYNGDADYILSHMGNAACCAAWIDSLNLTVASPWTAWKGSDGQVAGYFETYAASGSFTFLTVKGAGHMVPKDRPRHALDMFARFLAGGGYDEVPARPKVAPLCA